MSQTDRTKFRFFSQGALGRTSQRLFRHRIILNVMLDGPFAEQYLQKRDAILADAELARLLNTDVGVALVDVRRIASDENGRAVEYTRAIYRPDRFQYQMTMSMMDGEEANQWSPVEFDEG